MLAQLVAASGGEVLSLIPTTVASRKKPTRVAGGPQEKARQRTTTWPHTKF